jgi:predicted metal-dependent phosphoesterase TrpH
MGEVKKGAIYDLHCHSSASDGILRPDELVSRAKVQQVDVLALTDHDTLAGYRLAQETANALGVRLICGVEFSCQWGKQAIHVVGLNLNPEAPELLAALGRQQEEREKRAGEIAGRLAKQGIQGALEGARRFAGNSTLGRPHFAQFLVEGGHVASVNAAFKQYLGAGKVGDVKNGWPEFDEAVAWIKAAGGVAVLAHPMKYKMTRTKLHAMLADFVDAGGIAMEVIAGGQTPQVTADLAKVAERFQLFASCGSDFHRPDQPWQELGAFGTLPTNCKPVWCAWE